MRRVVFIAFLVLLMLPSMCYGQEDTPTPTATETQTATATLTPTATITPTPTQTRIPTVEIGFTDLVSNTTSLMQDVADSGNPGNPLSTFVYAAGGMIVGFGVFALIGYIWHRN